MNQRLLSAQVTYGKSPQPFLRSFLSIVADLSEDEARILRLFAEEPTQDIFILGVEGQLAYYDRALSILPKFGMALGNKGQGLAGRRFKPASRSSR